MGNDVITRLTQRLLGHAGLIRGYLAERICQPAQLVVAGDYPIDTEVARVCGAGPLVTSLREFANLYNWWLQAVTRLTPRLPSRWGWSVGYLAERVCQPVQLVVAGDYPTDAEVAGAGGAGPLVTSLREFANLCQRWLQVITQFNLSKHW